MRAIIGLGNPGSEYDGSRHNIGFAVVDAIAGYFRVTLRAGRGEFQSAVVRQDREILLVKPLTYMNNSGIAVQEILVQFDIELQDILVIFDDFHLPLGNIRLRASGSSGGHNGIASIIWHLQTHEFPRLRCGIGSERKPKDKQATAEFVLSPFAAEELESVNGMVLNARDAAIIVAQENLQAALNHISKAIR